MLGGGYTVKPIKIRELELDDGSFKICVVLTSRTKKDLEEDLSSFQGKDIDLIEWRVDYMDVPGRNPDAGYLEDLVNIRRMFRDKPLIATFRVKSEGGYHDMDLRTVLDVRTLLVESGLIDAIDIELESILTKRPEEERRVTEEYADLICNAKGRDIKVILSYHDFKGTAEVEDMVKLLKEEEHYGADLAKIAFYAKEGYDAIKLMKASQEASLVLSIPHIALSMGKEGASSRYMRSESKSALTYAYVDKSSAPGQMSLEELNEFLDQQKKHDHHRNAP